MLVLIENQCSQLEREANPTLRKGKRSKAHVAWLLNPTKKRQLKSQLASCVLLIYRCLFYWLKACINI